MRINPGFQVHSLIDGTLQIGSGSDALWISGLSAQERLFVLSLCGPGIQPQAPAVNPEPLPGPTSEAEAPPGDSRREEILRLLDPVMIIDEAPELVGLTGSVLSADVAQWSAAYRLDARAPLAARAAAIVCIRGLDRSGQLLAWILAAAGIGGLILEDAQPLRIGDLGSTPMRIGDVGLPRATAVRRALLRVHPRLPVTDSAVHSPGMRQGILEVVFGSVAQPPVPAEPSCLGWLPVVLRESGARIGPLLIPGLGLCTDCLTEQGNTDVQPVGLTGATASPVIQPELSLAATIAGIAATQCLMLIDQVNIPACADTAVEIDLATGAVAHVPAAARAGCTCLATLDGAA